jgi:hypothetical protein
MSTLTASRSSGRFSRKNGAACNETIDTLQFEQGLKGTDVSYLENESGQAVDGLGGGVHDSLIGNVAKDTINQRIDRGCNSNARFVVLACY